VSKWRPFSSSSIREVEQIIVGGGRQSCHFSTKISWWKRKCGTVCCRDATASSLVVKVQREVFANFHSVATIHHSSMRNWPFGLLRWILRNQLFDVKENYEHALGFVLHRYLFGHDEFGMPCMAHAFFSERMSIHFQGLRRTFPEICRKIWCTLAVGSIAKSNQVIHDYK
jgi:hypothetical protein